MDLDERGVSSIQVQKAQSLPVSLANGKLGGIPASDLQQEAHGNPSLPRSSRKSSHLHNAPQVSPYHLGKMTLSKGTTSNAVLKITDLKGHASRKPALVQSAAPAAGRQWHEPDSPSASGSFTTWTITGLLGVGTAGMSGLWIFYSRRRRKEQSAPMVQLKPTALIIVYCASGSILSWANKAISVGEQRLDPSVTLVMQNTATFVLIWFLAKVSPGTVRALRLSGWWAVFGQFVPLTGLFCMMLVSSLKALQTASIAAVVVQRNLISLVVAGAERIILRRSIGAVALISLVGILLGAFVFGAGDVEFDQLGYSWLFMNIVASAAFQILNKHLVHDIDLTSFGFSYFNNLISVSMLITWLAGK